MMFLKSKGRFKKDLKQYTRVFRGPKTLLIILSIFIATAVAFGVPWGYLVSWLMDDPAIKPYGLLAGALFSLSLLIVLNISHNVIKYLLFDYVRTISLGKLTVISGELVIVAASGALKIKILPGNFPVQLVVKKEQVLNEKKDSFFEAERVVNLRVILSPGAPPKKSQSIPLNKETISIPHPSDVLWLIDAQTMDKKFIHVGPYREGWFTGPGCQGAAEKIKQKMGLDYSNEAEYYCKIIEPLSENMASAIPLFLNQDEQQLFYVKTGGTYDQISEKLSDNNQPFFSSCNLALDPETRENLIAISSGFPFRTFLTIIGLTPEKPTSLEFKLIW